MTISKFMFGVCLCVSMVLVLTGSGITNAQNQTTIALPDANFTLGESGVIDATIDCGAQWCGDVVLTVHFDPAVLQVDSVDVGSYLGDQHVEIIDVDNVAGTVLFRATAIQTDTAATDNVLFRLNVQSLGVGQSALEITDLQLKDSDDVLLPVTSVNGSVTVNLDVDDLRGLLSTFDWRIVFVSERDGNPEIYVMDADGSNQTRLTDEDARDDMPVWSPSGSQIAFISERDGNPELYIMNADGLNPTRLTDNEAIEQMPAWSPDGSKIAFISDGDGNPELYVMDADGANLVRLTDNAALDEMPSWSPDSTTIAFMSNRDGGRGLFTIPAIGGLPSPVAMNENGTQSSYPAWSPDSGQIAFAVQNGDLSELQSLSVPTSIAQPIFDQDVRVDHLAWSRDMQWLVFGSESNDNQDISVVLIAQSKSEVLTDAAAPDYAPDLFDPQFCFVRTNESVIRVRVGPGTNRGIFGFFPANQDIRVLGQAAADDGSIWYEVDRTLIEGGATAVSLWVAQSEVDASPLCDRVVVTTPPPIVRNNPNPDNPGGWGFCGSCNTCGPYPTNECVTSPDGACLWDPTTCRNVIIVTPDPNIPPGQNCFGVTMAFRTADGSTMPSSPSQSVNTPFNCGPAVALTGYTLGSSVSVSTAPTNGAYFFSSWQSNCPISGGATNAIVTVNGNCTVTAVYDILI